MPINIPATAAITLRGHTGGGRVSWGVGGDRLAVVTYTGWGMWNVVSVFDTEELHHLGSLMALASKAMASCLRGRVGRSPEEVQEVLVQLEVPTILHVEIQRYL